MIFARDRAGRTGLALLAGTFAGAVVLATTGAAPASARPVERSLAELHAATQRASQHTLNWAGYVKTGKAFTSTAATWKVPTLKTAYPGYSSTWVGIDGASASDKYLIQTGTEADVIGGKAYYSAWWEYLTPTGGVPEEVFTGLTVRPGDSITGRVAKGSGSTWTMTLTDNTTKKSATHSVSFAGTGASAEWIEEDTDVNGYISTAPDWQSVAFSAITLDGASPALTSSQAVDIVSAPGLLGGLLGQGPVQETRTSAPASTRNAFSITWLATGRRSRA